MSKFLIEKFKKLKPYVPGEQPKERKFVKLNTNESPFPPSKKAIELAKKELNRLNLYPDPDCRELLSVTAKKLGVSEENIIFTNGSDDILNFAFMAYCNDNTPAIYPEISYGFYPVFADINNVPKKEIPLKEDFSIDINDYIDQNGTIIIANPNAPTGLTVSVNEIEELLKANRNRIVVIDEAYVDFGGESAIGLIKKYDNLLVTQTFSKSRSMAGARLGYGVASKEIINDLMRIKYSINPYNINRMTAAAGYGSIMDDEYFVNNCKTIIKNREYATNELIKLGFVTTESKANFIFAKHDKIDGKELYLKLKENGVLVRHFDKDRISSYVRITVGSLSEMQILIQTIKNILEKAL
ncbi:MAG: histidinol-phosphate transaminase [Clostridia bacterium]|nr:histidinol-phosphate transaminase [Clostridia bacterium]